MSDDIQAQIRKAREEREAREAAELNKPIALDPLEGLLKPIIPTRSLRAQLVHRLSAIFGKLNKRDLTPEQRGLLRAEQKRLRTLIRDYAAKKRARGERFDDGAA